jgi:NADPH:quinone reductase-like Zn-dependent oxidoreductase
MPWVGDHKINGMTVYPGAGVLVMAIEASKQLADSTKLVSGFEFRNVKFQQALSITSEGTEICFSMRKQHTGVPQYDVYSFSVYAIIYDKWIQTSVGEVHIRYEPPKHTDLAVSKRNELAHYQEMGRLRSNSINNEVDPTFMYEYLRNHGLGYGPQFQAMRRVFWGPDKLASTNVHLFESPLRSVSDEVYTVHPVTLDAVLHTIFPAMSLGGTTNMLTHIPIAIKNIWISARDLRYPENMDIEVFTDVHMETPHTTTSSLFALNKDRSKLIITGDGLRTSSVGDTQPNESLNTSEDLDWMWVDYVPDVDLLPASDTERYLSQRSSLLSKAKEYLSCLAKKTDSTRILCMGSSSSDLTKKLLDPFFTNPGTGRNVPRFQSITLTASSQSDLEILQKVFQDYPGDIKFQVLSGRHNMKEQGLEESYDLILATVINQDMTYLLKNGGKILTYLEPKTTDLESINGCNETGRNFSVATSSGELKHLDTILHLETHEAEQTSEITVLSSASSRGKTLPLLIVVDKGSSSQINMATILSQQFLQLGYSDIDTTTLADSVHHHQISTAIVIMLLDYDRPVLEDLNQDDYLALRNLIPMCRNILWTSGGGGLVPVSPGFGLINGLSRAVRVEFENLKLVTLALEPCQEVENHASMITRLVCGVFPGLDHGFYEREYIEIEGILHFKRMISDFNLRAAVSAHSRSIEEKVRSLAESPRFSLALPTHGTSDPLKFVHYQEQPAPLETNAIDVDIRAIGIGAIDALVESGNINRDGLGIEGSGVVSNLRYGSKSGLKKGDRVCFIGHNLLGSNACLQRQFVAKIPASMPLSDAATLPSDYTVAFYIVHDIIRPTKEDSILIFDPESSFSRALVRILATTGVSVMTATESSGRVFSELKFSERLDIQSITTSIHQARGKGLKAIVGPMGEILSSVDLVGSFGHIIAVKLPGDSEESDLSLTGIPSSVTFRVLDWMSVIEHSLSSTKYSLQDIFDSCDPQLEVQRGFMGHFPVAQIHDALKSLKGESASKKAIVELNPKDFLKVNELKSESTAPNRA